MPVDLGARSKSEGGVDFGAALRSEVKAQLEDVRTEMLDAILARLRTLQMVPPSVSVKTPPAPNVSVTPQIHVAVPETDESIAEAILAAMEEQAAAMKAQTAVSERISKQLADLTAIMAKPVTREVHRASPTGVITSMTEHR